VLLDSTFSTTAGGTLPTSTTRQNSDQSCQLGTGAELRDIVGESLANYTFSVNPLRLLAALLASRGIPAEPLFAAHGITTAMLDHTEARIPLITARRLWTEAERITGDRDLGLSVGEEGPLGAGVIAYAAQASATLGAAFRTLCRFHRLVTDAATVALILEGSRARLVLHTGGADSDPLPRHVAELYLALWVRGGRQLTGVNWAPVAVRFRHAQPPSIAKHERVFRAPLSFGESADEIELEASLLDLPFKSADPRLAAILERYGDEQLSRLPPNDDFAGEVRHAVASSLRNDDATLGRLAARFRTTPRTLQRRLATAGISLRTLVDDVRRQLALDHVARGELPIAEVAFLLGFDAVTSFHRAFRRWTGTTPTEYRQRAGTAIAK
jgi:AraC-like DNA-binding protein